MFKIGDFSKICQVSIKTLRHWEREGLVTPAHTDPFTSYRYYDISQLQTVNRIVAYKGLGLSLREIRRLLQEDLSPSEIRGMLKMKQSEIRQELEDRQYMLRMVEARLEQIEREGEMPENETIIKDVEPQEVVAIREVNNTMSDLVELIRMSDEARMQRQSESTGPLMGIFHDPAYHLETIDLELAFPVEPSRANPVVLKTGQEMCRCNLPGMEMVASTVHRGSWIQLGEGYSRLGQWVDMNGYEICGTGREVFHQIDWENNKDMITEVIFPIRRV